MRQVIFAIILISLSFTGFAAHAADSPTDSHAADLQKLVTPEQFKAALPARADELHLQEFLALQKQGPVVILDVRSKESFAKRHLKGSVNEPLTELTEKTLPAVAPDKNKPVVLTCDYSFMPTRQIAGTLQAYPVLETNGYKKIYRLNLWNNPKGGPLLSDDDQAKALPFEGTDVHPPTPAP